MNFAAWLYALTLAPFATFVVLYAILTRNAWRNTATGRGLMALGCSLVAILSFVLFALFTDIPKDIRDLLRVLTLGGVQIAGWLMVKNLVQEERRGRREDHPRRRATDRP
ncbi:hypothetical protein [Blastococcus sp. CT_GayMR16]|uniref:putative phage holin n=1 Tax=Blastococcus sp. CT_GayMR16 TaxID=2559607 RepID=UPI001074956A|nr:hypothetical protein [Blastococcus sp. CT_GayMR16]TFV91420.1 hypothetical protein E4P38_02190 [Blastococcus sp. CT_GayMR16]